MTKDEMITAVIRKYGFEHECTIWFCEMAEKLSDYQLPMAFKDVLRDEKFYWLSWTYEECF